MNVRCGSPKRGAVSQSSRRCERRWSFISQHLHGPAPHGAGPGTHGHVLRRTSTCSSTSARWPLRCRNGGQARERPQHTRHFPGEALLATHGSCNTWSFILVFVAPEQGQISISQMPPQPDSQFPEGNAGSAVVRLRPTGGTSRFAQSTPPVSQ